MRLSDASNDPKVILAVTEIMEALHPAMELAQKHGLSPTDFIGIVVTTIRASQKMDERALSTLRHGLGYVLASCCTTLEQAKQCVAEEWKTGLAVREDMRKILENPTKPS